MHLRYGEHIRNAFRSRGYSATQIADAMGISAQQVSNWVNDRADIPLFRIVELADLLGCTTDEILGRGNRETTYLDRVYETLNEEGKRSLLMSAEMHYMNPRFLPEDRAGKVRA